MSVVCAQVKDDENVEVGQVVAKLESEGEHLAQVFCCTCAHASCRCAHASSRRQRCQSSLLQYSAAGAAATSKSEEAQPDAQQQQKQQSPSQETEAKADVAPKVGGQPAQQERPQPSGRQDPVCSCAL